MRVRFTGRIRDCDRERTFRINEFCSSQSTSDFLLCEMSTVLRGLFFLMINCLFGCFDRILVLSVEDRCHLMSARGTGNFDILFISSGNRHKFTSMFNCASLVHPCTSVACCQTKFQVPLTALIRHLHFDDQYQYFVKHRKDGFYRKKQNRPLRTVTFHHMKINALRLLQNFLTNFSPTSQSPN